MSDLLRVIAVFGLIAGNAFFVIAEYSVVTAGRSRIVPSAGRGLGRGGAQAALRLMEDPVRVISTVQVGITAIGILTGAVGEPLVRDLLGGAIPPSLSFLLAFGVVTYLSVLLGELVPKALTLDRAERLVVVVARPVELLSVLLRPIVWALEESARVLLVPFGVDRVTVGDSIRSPEELRTAVDEAEEAGVIPRAQEEMLHNVFRFADREAADVMVLANDIAWIDARTSCADALGYALARLHNRYPVARGSLDRVIGTVHLRDLVAAVEETPTAPVERLARPTVVVPENKDLGPLLRELREQRQRLAIVSDEYGGTVGIVSVEDIVEEIVGDIEDEYQLPDAELVRLDDRTVMASGSMTIDDFNEETGSRLDRDGARTLAGLVFNALGHRPSPGEATLIGDVRFTVDELEDLRITRLRVELP